jgi:hypothetical protein
MPNVRALTQPESCEHLASRCVGGGINADLINCLISFRALALTVLQLLAPRARVCARAFRVDEN